MTKSQIDRLGERLKEGNLNEENLRLLDEYRRSFSHAYERVINIIRQNLNLEPTGRPTKSTQSIVQKLRRESIRLTQMQDVAGCRITVENVRAQEEAIRELATLFEKVSVSDRRRTPSHGYRAVHVVVRIDDIAVEVQVRTSLQHLWAELSEKLADVSVPEIKYGGGSVLERDYLARFSRVIAEVEIGEPEQDYPTIKRVLSDELRTMISYLSKLGSERKAKQNDLPH